MQENKQNQIYALSVRSNETLLVCILIHIYIGWLQDVFVLNNSMLSLKANWNYNLDTSFVGSGDVRGMPNTLYTHVCIYSIIFATPLQVSVEAMLSQFQCHRHIYTRSFCFSLDFIDILSQILATEEQFVGNDFLLKVQDNIYETLAHVRKTFGINSTSYGHRSLLVYIKATFIHHFNYRDSFTEISWLRQLKSLGSFIYFLD